MQCSCFTFVILLIAQCRVYLYIVPCHVYVYNINLGSKCSSTRSPMCNSTRELYVALHIALYVGLHVTPSFRLPAVPLRFRLASFPLLGFVQVVLHSTFYISVCQCNILSNHTELHTLEYKWTEKKL